MKSLSRDLFIFCMAGLVALTVRQARAEQTLFFNSSQVASLEASATTSDTITSEGYRFTYTRDKLFTGGVGLTNPVGRTVRVPWPQGVEAQAVTTGPTTGGAKVTVSRVDGRRFDLPAFTFKLLANTAGAGATLEIMPKLNGEDAFNDPLAFFATGYYGSVFSFNASSPAYLGSTASLTDFDSYTISLYVDFAVTALTLQAPDLNLAPSDISLAPASVPENEPVWSVVGSFDTADPNAGDTFTYSLVAGPGGTDNALFSVSGADLLTEASFNYEQRSAYSIRVQSEDAGGLSTQRVFTVTVTDVFEPPPTLHVAALSPSGEAVIAWDSLPNHTYTVHSTTNLAAGFTVLESGIPYDPFGNAYIDPAPGARQKFWKITTDP